MFFFFNDPATTEIYTLPLHDALPISSAGTANRVCGVPGVSPPMRNSRVEAPAVALPAFRTTAVNRIRSAVVGFDPVYGDRKSTRLNSSHLVISYAVFCLKKKKYLAV